MLVLPISIAKIIVSLRIRFQAAFERASADRDDAVVAAAEPPGCAGVQERHAADGLEALAILEKNHVDLAVLDVMMPGLNGLHVLKKLRENLVYLMYHFIIIFIKLHILMEIMICLKY